MLTFHLAFIILIIGAGITRYTGNEGVMHMREGESSNTFYTSEPNLMVRFMGMAGELEKCIPFQYNQTGKNKLNMDLNGRDGCPVQIKLRSYIPNAVENIEENICRQLLMYAP